MILILDRTTAGDGTTKGICPTTDANYRCLSTGVCNICGLISGVAEGCDAFSTSPVCDADSTVSGIQDSATNKVAACVACKKSGKSPIYLSKVDDIVIKLKCYIIKSSGCFLS